MNRPKYERGEKKTCFLPYKITNFFTTFVLFWRICLILAAKESIFLLEPRIFIVKSSHVFPQSFGQRCCSEL